MDAELIESISPSSAEVLRLCPLRLRYGRGGAGRFGAGPFARLGNASHVLLARAGRGEFAHLKGEALEAAFAAAWDEAIAHEQAAMQRTGEARFGSLARWRTYEITRARTRLAVEALLKPAPGEQTVSEQELNAFGGRLRGRPDRITLGPHSSVEDFKTGAIYELDEAAEEPRLRESYRRQLLLYAVLVRHAYGRWPNTARVIALTGAVEEFGIEPADALAVAEESLQLLDNYNAAVARHSPPEAMAQPSGLACSTCSYQHQCDPHWSYATAAWRSYLSVEGTVLQRQDFGDGTVALRVDVQRGTRDPGPLVVTRLDTSRFPDLPAAIPGSRVRLTKLRVERGGAAPGWFTSVRVI